MNPFVWNDKHSLGLPEIDREHRALFRMAEQFYEEIETGTAEGSLEGFLARLTSYANFHFKNEEALMHRTGFPEYAQHQQEHMRFATTVSSLETRFRTGDPGSTNALIEFLRRWLEQHVCDADRRLAEHVLQKRRWN